MSNESLAEQNVRIHEPPVQLSGWREMYIEFIEGLNADSVIDFGAGSPEFLERLAVRRRAAVDAGPRWADKFRAAGVEFHEVDLDYGELPALDEFSVAICSDVFEHLVFPSRTLSFIKSALSDEGVLLSHVPNEYRFQYVLPVALGMKDSVQFHPQCEEHDNPHLRRFTDIGFARFLESEFRYNVSLSDLKYGRAARLLRLLRITVPYGFQPGPTYASTNSKTRFEELLAMKKSFAS